MLLRVNKGVSENRPLEDRYCILRRMDLNLFCGRFFMACLDQLSILCALVALKERTQLNCSSLFKLSHATLILYS